MIRGTKSSHHVSPDRTNMQQHRSDGIADFSAIAPHYWATISMCTILVMI